MRTYRISLTNEELALIVMCLRSRISSGQRGRPQTERIQRLADRLVERRPGNPNWILGRPPEQKGA